MKQYVKIFENEADAYNWMRMKNRACEKAGNLNDVFCLVDGYDNNYAVVDINTAIDGGFLYSWSY